MGVQPTVDSAEAAVATSGRSGAIRRAVRPSNRRCGRHTPTPRDLTGRVTNLPRHSTGARQWSGWPCFRMLLGLAPLAGVGHPCGVVVAVPIDESVQRHCADGLLTIGKSTGRGPATKVLFGSVAATNLKVVSSTEITADSPAEPAGLHNVYVETSGGESAASAADLFTYT